MALKMTETYVQFCALRHEPRLCVRISPFWFYLACTSETQSIAVWLPQHRRECGKQSTPKVAKLCNKGKIEVRWVNCGKQFYGFNHSSVTKGNSAIISFKPTTKANSGCKGKDHLHHYMCTFSAQT